MRYVNLLVYPFERDKLIEWCEDRECSPADVLEYLIDAYLDSDELKERYPKKIIDEVAEAEAIKADLRYERNQDYKWGF